ncbi:NERD domain-containing protein [Agromyces sp. NPDC056965]|uniref:NERD domain-containing protein n=1 Tax=Agromyces sp. NPDC056965 TaxID=3345983 RepID=UPI003638306E
MTSGSTGIADGAPAATPPPRPPRGWYRDQADATQWRFWTGAAWTEHRHARDAQHTADFLPEGPTTSAAPVDLRGRVPAHSVIEKLIELDGAGLHAEQYSWHSGAIGERYVAELLSRLGPEWTVLHSVPVGVDGSDIDHVLIGPPGVFTINTKHHPGGRVWVAGRGLRVNNQPKHYLSNAAHEAARAERLLSRASGLSVEVVGIIVIVGASVTVKAPPHSDSAQIGVIPAAALLQTVQVRRAYSDEQLARIVAAAVRPETWSSARPKRSADPASLLAEFERIDLRLRSQPRSAPTGRAAPRSTVRRRRSFGEVVLRFLTVGAVVVGTWWILSTAVPLVLQNFAASSQVGTAERAELAALTASASAAASALDEIAAGGARPAALTITPGDALLLTDTGATVADLPDGTTGSYTVSPDGLSYTLTLTAPSTGATVTVTPELGVVANDG